MQTFLMLDTGKASRPISRRLARKVAACKSRHALRSKRAAAARSVAAFIALAASWN